MFSSTILGRKIFGEILCRSLYHSWSFLKYIWANRAKTWNLPGYWWFKRVESKLHSPSELDMFSFASSSSRSVPTLDKVLKRVGKIAKKIERRRFHFFLRPRNWLLVERNRAKYRQQMGMGVPSKESGPRLLYDTNKEASTERSRVSHPHKVIVSTDDHWSVGENSKLELKILRGRGRMSFKG